jgi:copper homeostasis protein
LILEVCVDSVESAVAAEQGGAERVELCSDLEHGGITPSIGLIRSVREKVSLKLHVMIRPRAGDFCYSDPEFEVMKRDIQEIKKSGADGLVFGILSDDRTIDSPRTSILLDLGRPLSVTFHRAFDETVDLVAALRELVKLGADRVLTSGGKASVEAGISSLAEFVRKSGTSIGILAGGGITHENVVEVVKKTGIEEVHVRSSVSTIRVESPSHPTLFHSSNMVIDASKVRRMVETLQGLSPRK